MKENTENDSFIRKYKYFIIFILIALCIILSAIIYNYLLVEVFNGKWKDSGTFGDSFGALNAIFSGLAFAGVIVTPAPARFLSRGKLK